MADIQDILQKYWGHAAFRPLQEEIIQSVLQGQDTLALLPTGGGKSICFQVPAMALPGICIVITPLIALMQDQVGQLNRRGIPATAIFSGLRKRQIDILLDNCIYGNTKFLYVSPERLKTDLFIERAKQMNISLLVIDEAHCISEWGHDFRPEYRRLREMMDQIDAKVPVVALTATATPKVQGDIVHNLGLRNPHIYLSSFNRPNLEYEVRPKVRKDQTIKGMVKFIHENKGKSGIIYTLNRKTTEELAELLNVNGIKAGAYHAGLDSKLRAERQDKFLNEDMQVIVATIAFGMGIDKPDIRFVIHYNIPKSLENYYQETGRAGRDGMEGKCILYYSHKDVSKLEHFLRDKQLSERELGGQLIDEMVAFAETGQCRRKVLMNYFGEKYMADNCGACDNCLHPKEQIEAKANTVKLLKVIKALDERFAVDYVVNITIGRLIPQIKMYRHDELAVFATGDDEPELYWTSLIRQMLLEGLLQKDITEQGILKISKEGTQFLKKPVSFSMTMGNFYEDAYEDDDEAVADGGGPATTDPQLFEMLKQLRMQFAKEKKLPPFVIFLETSLEAMATQYPTTLVELEKISGVSKGKAIRYGQTFVDLIAKYVVENDITKPDDFVMRSVVNKNGDKVFIIQQVDKKVGLDTIAKNRDMKIEQLLEVMETIVAGGTKLNLDYAIDQMVDQDDQEDILEYFKSCETSSLDVAKEELSDLDLEWEQLKIMRIKFLSVYGM